MMKKLLLVLAIALLPSLAWGQGAIRQNGTVAVGDLGMFIQDRTLESAAKYRTDTGKGLNPFSVLGEICSDSASRTGQFQALCLTHDASGNPILSVDSYNGLPGKPFFFRYNGVNYQFPFTVGGIVGPSSTAAGNAATWNSGNGTLLGDAGGPPGLAVATKAALQTLPSTAGQVRRDGFTAAGDHPSLTYVASGVACTVGVAGAGDGGSQVPTNDGKCWIASLPKGGWDIRWWGLTTPIHYVRSTGNDRGGANTCLFLADPCGTIGQAVIMAYKFPWYNAGQAIDIGAGNWNESVTANQPMLPSQGFAGSVVPHLYLKGAGSATVSLNGDGAQCGTIISNYGALVTVQGMTINATRIACQSGLYANIGGMINVWTDVKFGAANSNHMVVEEVNSFIAVWANYTVSGGAIHHWGVTAGGQILFYPANSIDADGVTITLTGTPAFTGQFAIAQHGGQILLANDTIFNGTATTVGGTYFAESGGNIITNNAGTVLIPGTGRGIVKTGGFAYPEAKLTTLNTTTTSTGVGTTGTTTISTDGSDSFFVTLSPSGTGILGTGALTVTLGSARQGATGNTVPCTASPNGGSGTWDAGATIVPSPNLAATPPTVAIAWKNGPTPTALTTGLNYTIGVNCR